MYMQDASTMLTMQFDKVKTPKNRDIGDRKPDKNQE